MTDSRPINCKEIPNSKFVIELVAHFHYWNVCPVTPDWYAIKLSHGATSMDIPYETFVRLSDGAIELMKKEKI